MQDRNSWKIPTSFVVCMIGFGAMFFNTGIGILIVVAAAALLASNFTPSRTARTPEIQTIVPPTRTIAAFDQAAEQALSGAPRKDRAVLTAALRPMGYQPDQILIEGSTNITVNDLCGALAEIANGKGKPVQELAAIMPEMETHLWTAAGEACEKFTDATQIVHYMARRMMVNVDWKLDETPASS